MHPTAAGPAAPRPRLSAIVRLASEHAPSVRGGAWQGAAPDAAWRDHEPARVTVRRFADTLGREGSGCLAS